MRMASIAKAKASAQKFLSEEIASDDSDVESKDYESDTIESEEEETVQEKKIRLAKSLIEEIEKQKETRNTESISENKDDEFFVSRKLTEDFLGKSGTLRREISSTYSNGKLVRQLRSGHRLAVTCVTMTPDMKFVFSGSKDGSIVKWAFATGKKLNTIKKKLRTTTATNTTKHNKKEDHVAVVGHTGEILCLAISDDVKFLASSGRDKSIKLWRPDTCEFIYNFEGHRSAVTGLVFRLNSHTLFSCSLDRSVKIWNADQLVYVETLFGHQDAVLAVDSLAKDRCVTCGARDRSVRMWKIPEESQLLFNGVHFDSIDCLRLLNEETYVSGSNDGSLAVWSIMKKKPIVTVRNAHSGNKNISSSSSSSDGQSGQEEVMITEAQEEEEEKMDQDSADLADSAVAFVSTGWISAVACLPNTDLLASGADDGTIRIWSYSGSTGSAGRGAVGVGATKLTEKFQIKIDGFVNDLKFSNDGSYLIAAIGQDHKLGRWSMNKSVKNSIAIIKFDIVKEILGGKVV